MQDYHAAHILSTAGRAIHYKINCSIMRCYCKRLCFYFGNLFFTFSLSLLIIWVYRRGKFNLNLITTTNLSNYYLYRKVVIPAQFVQHDDLNLLIKNNDNGDREFFVVEKNLDWRKFRTYVRKRRSTQKFGLNLSELLSNVRNKNPSFFQKSKTCSRRKTTKRNTKSSSSWRSFYDNIGHCDLYGDVDEPMKNLLSDMLNKEIKSVKNLPGGTQVKLEITFVNGYKAVMKPMRPIGLYCQIYSNLLKRSRSVFNAGFTDSMKHILINFISPTLKDTTPKLLVSIWTAKNLCFVGTCTYYCDTTHAICGNPDTIESSVQVFIPQRLLQPNKRLESPFTRTYSKHNQKALWQQQPLYCDTHVKNSSSAPFLLDIVDASILDFLTGNQDRHHFEFVRGSKNDQFFIHIDNGRSFGRSDIDDLDILAPLWQCCIIKSTTFETIMNFYVEPIKLSLNLNKSMSEDPLTPLLAEKHFDALERRLEIIVEQIDKCIFQKNSGLFEEVVQIMV